MIEDRSKFNKYMLEKREKKLHFNWANKDWFQERIFRRFGSFWNFSNLQLNLFDQNSTHLPQTHSHSVTIQTLSIKYHFVVHFIYLQFHCYSVSHSFVVFICLSTSM